PVPLDRPRAHTERGRDHPIRTPLSRKRRVEPERLLPIERRPAQITPPLPASRGHRQTPRSGAGSHRNIPDQARSRRTVVPTVHTRSGSSQNLQTDQKQDRYADSNSASSH